MTMEQQSRKFKLLKLWEIIQNETNEEHPMTTDAICERLRELGISGDRRTISEDIRDLNSAGYEILYVYHGHSKAYYTVDRQFSVAELKILMDAVQAANFITEKKSAELTEKLAGLSGSYYADLLKDSVIRFNPHKHTNEAVFYNVSTLSNALRDHRKISFLYFDRDARGDKIYRRDKTLYLENPVVMVYSDDNYYLICYNEKHEGLCHYRIDRMEQVTALVDSVCEEAILGEAQISAYTEQIFGMYGGESHLVTLIFRKQLLGVMQDRFGELLEVQSVDYDHYRITVPVQISPTFWGWLFMMAGDVEIESPQALSQEYRQRAARIVESVKTGSAEA